MYVLKPYLTTLQETVFIFIFFSTYILILLIKMNKQINIQSTTQIMCIDIFIYNNFNVKNSKNFFKNLRQCYVLNSIIYNTFVFSISNLSFISNLFNILYREGKIYAIYITIVIVISVITIGDKNKWI